MSAKEDPNAEEHMKALIGMFPSRGEYEHMRVVQLEQEVAELKAQLDAAHRAPADATQETSISAFEENMRRDKFDAGGAGLREAAQAIADDVCSMLCPSVKKTGTEWTHVEKCINLRAALAATPPDRDAEMQAVVDAAQLFSDIWSNNDCDIDDKEVRAAIKTLANAVDALRRAQEGK